MVDYAAAMKRPFTDMKTVVVSFVIALVPFVQWLLLGFNATAAQNTLDRKTSLPEWELEEVVVMAVKAAIVFLISAVYLFPAALFFGFGFLIALLSFLAGADTVALTGSLLTGGVLVIIGFVFFIFGMAFGFMGVMNYLREEKIGAAFAFGKLAKKVFTVPFWLSAIVVLAYLFVISFVTAILSLLLIGILLAPGLLGYVWLNTAYTIMAEVYNETP